MLGDADKIDHQDADVEPQAPPRAAAPVIETSELFGPHKQVVIGHNGCRYVLKITRTGKLVLNK